jgi:ParB-like chromosome segregation protein Spo0J
MADAQRLILAQPPEGFGIDQIWVDPRSIDPNPGNPRVHPPQQTAETEALIDELGWVQPLIYNRRTARLVDGHDRLGIAIRRGMRAVPVWAGEWDETQEARVIAAVSEGGRLARYDPARAREWLSRMKDARPEIAAMLDRLRSREGFVMEGAKIDVPEESREPARSDHEKCGSAEEPQDPRAKKAAESREARSAADIRMIQLYVDKHQLENWKHHTEVLVEAYGHRSTTDAVLRAVEDAYTSAIRRGLVRG